MTSTVNQSLIMERKYSNKSKRFVYRFTALILTLITGTLINCSVILFLVLSTKYMPSALEVVLAGSLIYSFFEFDAKYEEKCKMFTYMLTYICMGPVTLALYFNNKGRTKRIAAGYALTFTFLPMVYITYLRFFETYLSFADLWRLIN